MRKATVNPSHRQSSDVYKMPIKFDIPRSWKWSSSAKPQNTRPVEGKRRKVDDFTPKSPGGTQSQTQFEIMTKPFRNASNSVKGLFRRKSAPGSRYGNGKREFGARLGVPRRTLENRVTITVGTGQLTLEDLERELRRIEHEEEGSEARKRQRSLADSAYDASDDELKDPFADPSREGSQLSRCSTAGSLISKTQISSHGQLPRNRS